MQWHEKVGSNETGWVNVKGEKAAIQELHDLFIDHNNSNRTYFDNSKVVIVDEVRSSGDTLVMAKKFFEEAFPTANIVGKYWMIPETVNKPKQGRRPAEIPVWYREWTAAGRGVADINQSVSMQSSSSRQRKGWHFLSTRPERPDLDAEQLRQEIKQLAQDVRLAKINYILPGRQYKLKT